MTWKYGFPRTSFVSTWSTTANLTLRRVASARTIHAFVEAVRPPLSTAKRGRRRGLIVWSAREQDVGGRRFDEPGSIADGSKHGDRKGAHGFKLQGESAHSRGLDRSET